MLSVCVLYSMMVLGGRLRTLRRVSLMRAVVAWSLAVLFQMEMMSSCGEEHEQRETMSEYTEVGGAGLHATGVCWCVYLEAY